MGGGGPNKDFVTLLIYWACTYLSAVVAAKTRLSPLLFYLVFGCILGNCKVVEPSEGMHFLSEVGITLVFFALGFEETVHHFLGGIRKAWGIASIGAFVPFLCGFAWAYIFYADQGIYAMLMCGLAVTATAVSLTMISLKSEGLAVSKPAIGIMTSAVLDDVMCLALVAIMVPIATGQAEPTVLGIGWVLAKSAIFFSIIIFLHLILFPHLRKPGDSLKYKLLSYIPGLRSVGVHVFIKFKTGEQAVLAALAIGLSVGVLASLFSFHPAIGAYMAGLILEERYFDVDCEDSQTTASTERADDDEEEGNVGSNVYFHVRDIVESAAFCWIGPLFFLNMGAHIIIDADLLPLVVGPAFALYAFLLVGQVLSAAFAARYVPGGFTWAESWMIGIGMLGRAELFFVVINICYVENAVFNRETFFAMTLAAMLLNITVPASISLYKPYYLKAKAATLQPDSKGRMKRMSTLDMASSMKGMVHIFKRLKNHDEEAAARRVYSGTHKNEQRGDLRHVDSLIVKSNRSQRDEEKLEEGGSWEVKPSDGNDLAATAHPSVEEGCQLEIQI